MRKLVVGFSKPSAFKLGAFLIKLWIKRQYSHVYLRYRDDQERDLVFQAAHGTVHSMLFSNFEKDNIVIKEYSLDITDNEYQQFRDIYYGKSGLLYSIKGLMSIPIYDIFKSKLNDDSGYICSELAGYTLNSINKASFSKPFNLLRPDDIEEAICHG